MKHKGQDEQTALFPQEVQTVFIHFELKMNVFGFAYQKLASVSA